MPPDEQESRIWALETDTGKLQVHVVGTPAALDRVALRLRVEVPDRTNRETLLAWLTEALAKESATIADRLDRAESDQPRDLAARIREIQRLTDVSKAFKYLLALFEVSGSSEIDYLISSSDVVWVCSYIESVLHDLDENAENALNQLNKALEPYAAYILLPSSSLP